MSATEVVFVRRASGLVREVGPLATLAIVACHVIGGGINFYSVKASIGNPGANIPLAFVIAGIPTVILAACFTLLSIQMPRTGGDYIFITRTLGPPIGFLASWSFWFTEVISYGIICALDVWFWGLSVWTAGLIFHNPAWMDIGVRMQTDPMWIIGLGTLINIITFAIVSLGARVYAPFMNVVFLIPLVGSICTLVALGVWGPVAKMKFDAVFGAGAWDRVVEAAKAAGWTHEKYGFGVSWSETMKACTPATWAYIGFTAAAFVGSEVKEPSKSFFVGMTIGSIFIIILYVLYSGFLYWTWGDFVSMYTFLAANKPEALAAALGVSKAPESMLPFFAAICAYPIAPMAFFIAVTGAIWLWNDCPAFFLVCSRTVFAWAFDRFFPEVFAYVEPRFHSPIWANVLTAVIGEFGVVATAYNWWITMVGTTVLCIFRYLFAALTSIMIPYIRPEIWERGLAIKVAGIPLDTILGLIAFTWWSYIFWWACLELDALTIATYAAWWAIGMAIFVGFYIYNIKRGIDPTTIYKEVPPA